MLLPPVKLSCLWHALGSVVKLSGCGLKWGFKMSGDRASCISTHPVCKVIPPVEGSARQASEGHQVRRWTHRYCSLCSTMSSSRLPKINPYLQLPGRGITARAASSPLDDRGLFLASAVRSWLLTRGETKISILTEHGESFG